MNIFKSTFKTLFAKPDEATNDKLGAYPVRVHVGAMPERRYLKTSRVMALLASALWGCALILAFSIYLLGQMQVGTPLLLSINKRFYRLDPVQNDEVYESGVDIQKELYIRQYVILRHTILPDVDEMKERWGLRGHLRWFSQAAGWDSFTRSKESLEKAMENGLTAEVSVRFIEQLTARFWIVEFDLFERYPEDDAPTVKRYRAFMEALFYGKMQPFRDREDRLKNPLNFVVLDYFLMSRALTEENKNAKFID